MEYREFATMTNSEIREIVTDIFHPEKITGIRWRKDGSFICTIHMIWSWEDSDGNVDSDVLPESLIIRDPFIYGKASIELDNSTIAEDYDKLYKYCFAKGMVPWLKDNPYMEKGA